MRMNKKKTSRCPYCGEKIPIGDRPKIGQYLVCSICDEKVEIVSLDPVVLDLVFDPDGNGFNQDEYEQWDRSWKRT